MYDRLVEQACNYARSIQDDSEGFDPVDAMKGLVATVRIGAAKAVPFHAENDTIFGKARLEDVLAHCIGALKLESAEGMTAICSERLYRQGGEPSDGEVESLIEDAHEDYRDLITSPEVLMHSSREFQRDREMVAKIAAKARAARRLR